jgi:hypothetical protein
MDQQRFCGACGTPNPATNAFCSNCGAAMGAPAAAPVPAAASAAQPQPKERSRGRAPLVIGLILALLAAGVAYATLRPDAAKAEEVFYQDPLDEGPDPITAPVDVPGKDVGLTYGTAGKPQPFGGSGDNTVCKPLAMIAFLKANPARARAWADVVGIEVQAIETFIKTLTPRVLTRDTRVTNHGYKNGKAYPLQSILAAGTAVLVDKDGKLVARCRCGNPLKEPQQLTRATCVGCPERLRECREQSCLPRPCREDCGEPPCLRPNCDEIPEDCLRNPKRCVPPCDEDEDECTEVCPLGAEDCEPPENPCPEELPERGFVAYQNLAQVLYELRPDAFPFTGAAGVEAAGEGTLQIYVQQPCAEDRLVQEVEEEPIGGVPAAPAAPKTPKPVQTVAPQATARPQVTARPVQTAQPPPTPDCTKC